MNLELILNIVGVVGVVSILLSYALLQTGRLQAQALPYLLLNFLGSSAILASLMINWNLSAALVEFAWATISLLGMIRWWWNRSRVSLKDPL